MKYLLASLLAILGLSTLHAQDCRSGLHGQVMTLNSKQPIPAAKITIMGTDQVTYTDFEGKYAFEKICNGVISLKITADHAQEKIVPVLIDGATRQKIFLDQHPIALEKVVVVGASEIRKSKTAQQQTLSGEDIDNFSSASLGDALKKLTGVSALNTGKDIVKPIIQGLSGSRVPVFNHGVELEDQEWGDDHAPSIDLNSAGKLTVIKGAAALQYGGDAIGGVIIAKAADIPRKDTLFGQSILSGSTNGRGGSISSSLTKAYDNGWYVNLQGTYKKFGDYKTPDYILSNTGTDERDFSINAGLHKFHYGFDAYYSLYNKHLGILRASSTGSVSDLVQAINSDQPIYIDDFSYAQQAPRQKVQHQLARLKFYRYFDQIGKLQLSYSYQSNNRLEYDIRRGNYKYKPSVDLNLQTHAAAANFDFKARNDRGLNIGVDWSYKDNFADPRTGVQRIIPDYHSHSFGAFATGFYEINRNWLIEAGLRYDYSHIDAKKYYNKVRWHAAGYDEDFADIVMGEYGSQYLTHPIFSYDNISATAGVKYTLSTNYLLRLNYALSNRAPNPSELFSDGLHHSAASIELGDLRLDSEHSGKLSLSFEKQAGDFTFIIAPYLNRIDNFINMEPRGVQKTVRGAFLKYKYQQNDARLIGMDVDVNYKFNKHFSYHGNFSTVDGREIDSDRPLIAIPPTNTSHTLTYKNPDWHQLTVSLHGNAVFTKQHYPNDNFYIKVIENGSYQNKLVDISTPPKGYFLTGLDASAIFHPFQRGSMQVRLAVSNLFDVRYRDYLNRLRYFADNLGRNFTLQLKFNY